MQAASGPQRIVLVQRTLAFDSLAPVGGDPLQVGDRMDPCGLHELGLGTGERLGVGLPGPDQHAERRHRQVAVVQGTSGDRHLLEPPCCPKILAGGSPRDLERAREPRRRRQMAVALEQAASLDLAQASKPLGLELLDGSVKLCEDLLDASVGQLRQRLGAKCLDLAPELAHVPSASNIRS